MSSLRADGVAQSGRAIDRDVGRSRLEWAATAAFAALVLAITVRLLIAENPARHNVYLSVFAAAAQDFTAGRGLYLDPGMDGGFRYPPLCAALFVPFAACGPVLGSILWRLLNAAVLLLGMRAVARAGLPVAPGSGERALGLAVVTVASITSLNNGQANPLLLGLFLLATASTLRARTAGAAVGMTIATACKIYPLAYAMVLAVLRPRLWFGLALGLLLVALLPYALQRADYVTAQYQHLFSLLAAEDRTLNLGRSYRDLRLIAAAIGEPLPTLLFRALQLLGGLAIVVVASRRRRAGASDAAVWTFACSATMLWFLLLGPATEKATYVWIAPPLVSALILAWREGARLRLGLAAAALLLVVVDNLPLPTTREVPLLRCLEPFAALLLVIELALSIGTRRNGAVALP